MKIKRVLLGILFIVLLLIGIYVAVQILSVPDPDIYVKDYAGILSEADINQIQVDAQALDRWTGAQLIVVTVDSLEGDSIEQYANTLFSTWRIGDSSQNNGILLLIAMQEGEYRIEVGYGLENVIRTDTAESILGDMTPYFQREEYSQGTVVGFDRIFNRLLRHYKIDREHLHSTWRLTLRHMPWRIILALGLVAFIILMIRFALVLMGKPRLPRGPGKGGGGGDGQDPLPYHAFYQPGQSRRIIRQLFPSRRRLWGRLWWWQFWRGRSLWRLEVSEKLIEMSRRIYDEVIGSLIDR